MSEAIERNVSAFVSNKDNSVVLRRVDNGGYTSDEVTDLVVAIVGSKAPVSQWTVWDARTDAPKTRRAKPYSAAEFKALVSGQDVALVWCKRGTFRAPVIKIGAIDTRPERTKNAPTRIGK